MSTKDDDKKRIRAGNDRPLRIGTRKSPLAMKQAEMAAKAILSAHGWRRDQVELVPMVASGDKIQDRALAEVGGKALWTKELDRALMDGEIDCAVHSMKDVETVRPDEFVIAAMLERGDVHDRIVGAEFIDALPKGAIVGTASPRRKAQLLQHRSDLEIQLIRGNVQTRLDRIKSGEFQASLLAAAGLVRLGMEETGHDIPTDIMLPAPAQGAIGIETLSEDQHLRRILHAVSDQGTFRTVTAERGFLKALNADCHSPVAALAQIDRTTIFLRAQILRPDGSEYVYQETDFESGDVAGPERLAQKMLVEASEELRAVFGE